MQTPKEKAEEYVRKQIPELMELSFGCRVKYPSDTRYASADELDNPQFTEARVLLHDEVRGFDDWDEYFYTFNDWNEYEDISGKLNDGELEIIGHPIQLQHWVKVLGERAGAIPPLVAYIIPQNAE